MPRPRKSIPSYRLHTPSGNAYSDFTDPLTGRRRSVCLGRWDSPESRAEHARLVAEAAAGQPAPAGGLTVSELLLVFLRHAEQHYRRADGTPTSELPQFAQTFRLLRRLYGHTPANEFGPRALKAVREQMIAAGWSRKLVNQRVGRIRRAFRWGVENELVPPAVLHALAAVPGLQAGRTAARETDPVEPADDAVVDATLPFLRPAVAAMVRVQRLTGMRPGEVCQLRPADLDTGGPVWKFTPPQYKTRHRGKGRVITLGPRAQAELAAFTPADPTDYFFSPRRVVAGLHAERAANRRTPRYRSHTERNRRVRKTKPERVPSARYTVTSYGRAVGRVRGRSRCPPRSPAGRVKRKRGGGRG